MFEIKKLSSEDYSACKKFLLCVPSIEEIDDLILQNAVIVVDDSNIVGCVSYEEFCKDGLIRYFVFKRVLSEKLVKELFLNLEEKALANKIERLFCVVNDSNIENLFLSLGFSFIDTNNLYIDEDLFTRLEYGSNKVMSKLI